MGDRALAQPLIDPVKCSTVRAMDVHGSQVVHLHNIRARVRTTCCIKVGVTVSRPCLHNRRWCSLIHLYISIGDFKFTVSPRLKCNILCSSSSKVGSLSLSVCSNCCPGSITFITFPLLPLSLGNLSVIHLHSTVLWWWQWWHDIQV